MPNNADQELITSTAKWTLVVQRVSQSSVQIWVGALFGTLLMPDRAKVDLTDKSGQKISQIIERTHWRRPFRNMNQRFYSLIEFDGLEAGARYKVTFSRWITENLELDRKEQWLELHEGDFTTLPNQLPRENEKPFTVGLGSCFYSHRDGGRAASAYRGLYDRGDPSVRPDITFLTGDQVYLDIGFDSLSLWPREIRQRIGDDYAQHWQLLGSILTRGATWMLPDDHEYWNDYPFYDSLIPTLLSLKIGKVRKAWTRASQDAVNNIQRTQPVETFDIGADLSFCLADLRSHRDKNGFLPPDKFTQLTDWAKNLTSPGVLVIPQPLIVEKNKTERNLLSFPTQYSDLLEAMGKSGHDIVVLSGDVHFGRIATAPLGSRGGRLVEIISSPLSNLTGLNGIATAIPKFKPKTFPDSSILSIPGWPTATVTYDRTFAVSTKGGRIGSAYPCDRTREHFMTIGFQRKSSGGIELSVNAWRVRDRDENYLPAKDFPTFAIDVS